ncbi:hypothetical protein CBS101457_002938 [Exobasidium rhododendri]|nr:hypothetical protein CBS101457_002938 [Exobasidium rhododendri]
MSSSGRLPREIYDFILKEFLATISPSNDFVFWLPWASVCRSFRDSIRRYVSQTVKVSVDTDYDVFRLQAMTIFTSGQDSIIDLSLTKKFICDDKRFDLMYDPSGTETVCFGLVENYESNSFLDLLNSKNATEASEPYDYARAEQAIKDGIKLLCYFFSQMPNLEEIHWKATVPLTDSYDSVMPLCGAIPTSNTIAAQWLRTCRKCECHSIPMHVSRSHRAVLLLHSEEAALERQAGDW